MVEGKNSKTFHFISQDGNDETYLMGQTDQGPFILEKKT